MPTPDKAIRVFLIKQELQSRFPEYSISLGAITATEYERIKADFLNAKLGQSECMRYLNIGFNENTIFGTISHTTHYHLLGLSGMSWLNEDKTPLCKNCIGKTDREKMDICARNFRDGNCRDSLMRRTFGAVLFPQFYAKDKQK